MKQNKTEAEITITGVVTPIEWDGNNVIAIGIATGNDNYIVKLDRVGEELFDFVDDKVKLTGAVKKDRHGNNKIAVVNYEPAGNKDNFAEDENHDHDAYYENE